MQHLASCAMHSYHNCVGLWVPQMFSLIGFIGTHLYYRFYRDPSILTFFKGL